MGKTIPKKNRYDQLINDKFDCLTKKYKKKFNEGKTDNFDNRLIKHPHQTFWEVYLASVLIENKIDLKKKEGQNRVDFYFMDGTTKIHIEAVAPKVGDGNDLVRPTLNNDNFEDGMVPYKEILLRLTSVISGKIKNIEKKIKNGIISSNDKIILAINAYEALNGWGDVEDFLGKYIYRVLFQTGDMIIDQRGKECFNRNYGILKKNKALVPNNYFLDQNTLFDGIIYSKASKNSLLNPHDFTYIQNSNKEDITQISSFCNVEFNNRIQKNNFF